MLRLKRTALVLQFTAATVLFLAGGRLASAQGVCTSTSSSVHVRIEGTVELLGTITLSCTGVAATPTTITVTVGAPLAAASETPDNKTTFPLPVLTSSAGFIVDPEVSTDGNLVNFRFTPAAGSQTFSLEGFRADIATAGLRVGEHVTAAVHTSSFTLTNPSPRIGIVASGLGQGSGFPNPLTRSTIRTPSRQPSFVAGNPDPSTTASNSLRVVFAEGFAGAFLAASREDGGSGLQGTRFRVQLRGISAAIVPYAPRAVRITSASTTGRVSPASSSLVIQRVDDPSADGSGGIVLPEAPDQFDKIEVTNGTAILVYEVTSDSPSTSDTLTLFIALTVASTPVSANIRGSFSLAPLGPPSDAPARPQFTFSTAISRSPRDLEFIHFLGSLPSPRRVFITNPGAGVLNWNAVATTDSGGDWLGVTPAGGTDDGTITVSIREVPLREDIYRGKITISSADAVNSPQTVSVSLQVASRPVLLVTPLEMSFRSESPGTALPSQQLTITNAGILIPWTATVQTTSGGNWLSLSSASGVSGFVGNVNVNAAGLSPGAYQGSIRVTAPDTVNGSVTVPVSLLVGSLNTVVNAASFLTGAGISRGMTAVLFGSGLSETAASAPPGTLPTLLRNTQVLVNGVAAPLSYVSPSQINFQVPLDISGSSAQVVVVSNGIQGQAVTLSLAEHAPGIFMIPGTGGGTVLNQDSTPNSAANPAHADSIIQIFATGLGAVSPQVPAGQPAPLSPLSNTTVTPVVLIGGIPAEVSFSGLSPGTVGVYQVNARIPSGIPAGSSVTLQIQMGAASSNTVTIAVQ